MFLLTGDWFLSLCLIAHTWATLYVGWGSYFGMGEEPASSTPRAGVFDFIIGYPCGDWSYTQRFMACATRSSLLPNIHGIPCADSPTVDSVI